MFTISGSHNPMKDWEVSQPPDDSISKISFSPNANYLVASSWNNAVRCWEVQDNGSTIARAEQQHSGPVLDCCWTAVRKKTRRERERDRERELFNPLAPPFSAVLYYRTALKS